MRRLFLPTSSPARLLGVGGRRGRLASAGLLGIASLIPGLVSAAQPAGRLVGFGARVVPYLEGNERFRAVSCSSSHGLALKEDGSLLAWGANTYGQADVPPGLPPVRAVGAGGSVSVVLLEDGTVRAWGGQRDIDVAVPADLSNVVAISVGSAHTLALRGDGTVASWGSTADGRRELPVDLNRVVSVAAGGRHSLVALEDGTVRGWGYNLSGQINVPADVTNAVAVAAGSRHSLAGLPDGRVRVWRSFGGLRADTYVAFAGGDDQSYGLRPDGIVVSGLQHLQSNVVALASGTHPEFAVSRDGRLVTWAREVAGVEQFELAQGEFQAVSIWDEGGANHLLAVRPDGTVLARHRLTGMPPTLQPPAGLSNVVAVSPGGGYGMALREDGTVVTWGDRGGPDKYPVPEGLAPVVAIAAGGGHRLALRADGTVVSWGAPLGPYSITPPPGLSNVVAIAAGVGHSVALKSDGTLVGWGERTSGQLSFPPGMTNVVAIAAAARHTLALTTGGRVLACGNDLPARVPEDLDEVVVIATCAGHALALRRDGTVVRWGSGGWGSQATPAHVRDIVALAAGGQGDFAIRVPFRFTRVTVTDRPRLSFWALAGRRYAVQFRGDLSAGTWADLQPEPLRGAGTEVTVQDEVPNATPHRFYRLVALP